MSVVIAMLFYTLVSVGALVWFYYENISLSDVWARRIEILGYVLLIVIAIWEFAIKNVAFSEFYNADWFFLNEKLHYIFHGVTSLYDGSFFDTSTSQAWNGFYAADPSDYVQDQLFVVDCAEAVLQVFSAGCIGIGRLQELKNKKKDKAHTAMNKNKRNDSKHKQKKN